MKQWFKNPAIRHFSSVLLSVALSVSLAPYLGSTGAAAIGHAAGQVVGG